MINPYGGYTPFTNYQNPYGVQNMQNNNFNAPNVINGSIIKVSGINGVNALNLAPNTSVLALDETQPIVWLVSADSAGYKTPTPYDITPHVEQKSEKENDLEARVSRLEALINEQSNNKQNANNSKRNKSADDSAN